MSRGQGKMQKAIMKALESKEGRATTKILMEAIGLDQNSQSQKVSFYRALNGLQNRGLITWYKEHGGVNSPHGLVCITRKNVLLIDFDSKIANLALMKVSSYHKNLGHNVYLQRGGSNISNPFDKPDIVYISCIFSWNKSEARKLARQYQSQGVEVHIGGSGVSLSTRLPAEIESQPADYNLYPEIDYSIGYCVRGCPRSCPWCIVSKKDGKPRAVADIYDIWDKHHKTIVLLDDNILALPEHFRKISKQVIKEKLKVKFHALDIRFVDDDIAALLKQMKIQEPKFSWDNTRDLDSVLRGIEILRRNGIRRAFFYVLAGFKSEFEDALYRVKLLRDLGQTVFVMIYNIEFQKDRRYLLLRNYCNAHHVYGSTTFEEYIKGKM
ncbi:MAG: hypothetical protein PHU23_01205 [Dehalococcoidales bacterium]|nr:hypothetical protein [Dehalococcoidales bacterium]